MADGSKLDVNASSLIDLKAELFRKQEEFKQLKLRNSSDFVKGRKVEKYGRPDIWSKKNAGVSHRSQKDIQETGEDEDVMKKSRKALEAKTKIYDKIASSSDIPDDDGSEGYLVDFQKKAIDRVVEERRKEPEVSSQGRNSEVSTRSVGSFSDEDAEDGLAPPVAEPDEEWVDYIDTFGRSRRCMKKDLPHLEKQERILGKGASQIGLKLKADAPTLLSADMRTELHRQKWEQEMEQGQHGPVHYSNVQFDEIRTHGVGYYQFSKDSTLREEQMTALNKLREQTLDGRLRSERIKEKRKAALDARLAKVKQRRKMKDGSQSEENCAGEKQDETEVKEKPVPKAEPEPIIRDDSWRLTAPVREWDKGKEKMPQWSEKRYMEDRRNEREEEFAPPQFYYNSQPKTTAQSVPQPVIRLKQRTKLDSVDIKIVPSVVIEEGNTEAMLLEMRNSSTAAESDGIHTKDQFAPAPAEVDLSGIPLPSNNFGDKACSVGSSNSENGLDTYESRSAYRFSSVPHFQASHTSEYGSGMCQMQSQASSVMFYSSVPPPGWEQGQPLVSNTAVPSFASDADAAEGCGNQSGFPEGSSGFLYPSQQGVLTAQSKQQQQQPFRHDLGPVHGSRTNPQVDRSAGQKTGIVDKRFMQNKEASEADLLGVSLCESEDALVQVKPVSYQPGQFSTPSAFSSVSCDTKGDSGILNTYTVSVDNSAEINSAGKASLGLPEDWSKGQKPAVVQTESVIFGVPDFLQPAAGVEAKAYEPGSFMAAKVAAAERAEEAYEAARQKKSYSSAPVLYNKPSASACDKGDNEK